MNSNNLNERPQILFFDSGMGGLSVFKEVFKLNPYANYYYLFDHECFPYSNKSEVFLKERVYKLLQEANCKIKLDLIVIACNTASTIVLPELREHFSCPIVGVVPAIKPAAKSSKTKKIALLATQGTIHRAYTSFLINEFAFDCKVLKIGTEALVRLAENSLLDFANMYKQNINNYDQNSSLNHTKLSSIQDSCVATSYLPLPDISLSLEQCFSVEKYQQLTDILQPIIDANLNSNDIKQRSISSTLIKSREKLRDDSLQIKDSIDTVVLGCTHFPLLKRQIAKILGEHVLLVDSGEAIARRVRILLCNMHNQHHCSGVLSFAEELQQMHYLSNSQCIQEELIRQDVSDKYKMLDIQDVQDPNDTKDKKNSPLIQTIHEQHLKKACGAKIAFYTGQSNVQELALWKNTFELFGFSQVQSF